VKEQIAHYKEARAKLGKGERKAKKSAKAKEKK
jgi:hypothetical protein